MNGGEDTRPVVTIHERLAIVGGLAIVSTLAWVYTIRMAHSMGGSGHCVPAAAGHGGHHLYGSHTIQSAVMPYLAQWGLAEIWMTYVMWGVMMAAMMLPTAIPMALAFAQVNRQNGRRGTLVPVGAFAAGYLGAWALYCVGATAVQWGLLRAALLSPVSLASGPVLGGVVLIAAGIFQWSSWKDACMQKCRNPLGFLLTHWRPGHLGAFKLGSRYGLHCVGCCWLLMLICFALGVMNLVWMALLTLFMLVEKIAPAGRVISRAAGALLVLWGGWMVFDVSQFCR
jgi:predicted metal-binding membrane protein